MTDRLTAPCALLVLSALVGCAAVPTGPASPTAARPAAPSATDPRPLPVTTAPVPVVPPARSGSGRAAQTPSGASAPEQEQTVVTPQRRPTP